MLQKLLKKPADGTTLKEAAIELGIISVEDFDKFVVPEDMVG